jgi:hypothetical protein
MIKNFLILLICCILISCAQDPQLFKKEQVFKKKVMGKHVEYYHEKDAFGEFHEYQRLMIETNIDTFQVETYKEYNDIRPGDFIQLNGPKNNFK